LTAKRRLAALLLSLIVVLQILAAVPALHSLVHDDANSPNHECAVTMFLHGQVDASASTVEIVLAPSIAVERAACFESSFVSRDILLPSNRGPPLFS
jgi:hypothetical protein